MITVLLFHHALGLTPGVEAFADRLREAGYRVITPDLFEGRRFDTLETGVAHVEEIGFQAVIDRGVAASEGIEGPLVTVGFSLGVLPAQGLAQNHPGVVGAILYHAAVPGDTFGEGWPEGVALQMHLAEGDPWVVEDLEAARGLAAESEGELFLYPGTAHLVADSSFTDHDPELAERILTRTLRFLASRAREERADGAD